MRDEDVSPKVRVEAASTLLTHLAKPKETGAVAQINLDLRDTSGVSEMRKMLAEMAEQQQKLIMQGVTAKELAAQKLVLDVESKDVTD